MKIASSLARLVLLAPSGLFALTIGALILGGDSRWLVLGAIVTLAVAIVLLPLVFRLGRAYSYLSLGLLVVSAFMGMAVSSPTRGDFLVRTQETSARLFVSETSRLPLVAFRVHVGRYPSTAQGLDALIHCPTGLEAKWRGPYVDDPKKLLDPWGHPFQYRYPGTHNTNGYDLWSLGPDGQPDTADDIRNW